MKQLKKFEFPVSTRGRQSYIDWEKILDGNNYLLTRGEDYQCQDDTLRTLIYRQARLRGKTVRMAEFEKGKEGALVIQAQDASPDQLKLWADQYRKREERAAREAAEADGEFSGEPARTT
jgi:hypothetical protein